MQTQLLLDRYAALETDLSHCCEKKRSMQMRVMRQLLTHPPRDCRKRLGAGEIVCRDELERIQAIRLLLRCLRVADLLN